MHLHNNISKGHILTALIGFLTRVVIDADFDGIYLDNRLNDEIFIYSSVAKSFDSGISLPGLATTSAEANALYAGWAPVLSYGLRLNLDANRPDRTNIIIGNAAGPISDPALSGLTLEMEACVSKPRHGMKVNCTDASLAQAAVTHMRSQLSASAGRPGDAALTELAGTTEFTGDSSWFADY